MFKFGGWYSWLSAQFVVLNYKVKLHLIAHTNNCICGSADLANALITNYHWTAKVLVMLQFDWHVQITHISSFMLGCISRASLHFCALCTFVIMCPHFCSIAAYVRYLLSNERYSSVLPILNSWVRPRFVTFINHLNHHRDLLCWNCEPTVTVD